MSASDPHDCQFPEEQTPEGVRILLPCLLCGLAAADGMKAASLKIEQLHEQVADLQIDCTKALGLYRSVEDVLDRVQAELSVERERLPL